MIKCRKLCSVYLHIEGGGVAEIVRGSFGTQWLFEIRRYFRLFKTSEARSLFIAHGRFNQNPQNKGPGGILFTS